MTVVTHYPVRGTSNSSTSTTSTGYSTGKGSSGTISVNPGGPGYTDTQGNSWSARLSECQDVLPNFDVVATARAWDTAVDKQFTVNVSNRVLQISFDVRWGAEINGIQISPAN